MMLPTPWLHGAQAFFGWHMATWALGQDPQIAVRHHTGDLKDNAPFRIQTLISGLSRSVSFRADLEVVFIPSLCRQVKLSSFPSPSLPWKRPCASSRSHIFHDQAVVSFARRFTVLNHSKASKC